MDESSGRACRTRCSGGLTRGSHEGPSSSRRVADSARCSGGTAGDVRRRRRGQLCSGAGAVVSLVHVAHVASAQGLHHAADAADSGRRHEQVHVVGHQYVGMDRAAFTPGDFIEIAQVASIIVGGEEARLAIVAALDHMLCDSGKIESGWARHVDVLVQIDPR